MLRIVFCTEYPHHVGTKGTICLVVGIATVSSWVFIKQLCAVNVYLGEKSKTYTIKVFFSCYITSKGLYWIFSGFLGKFSGFSHESAYWVGSSLEVPSLLDLAGSAACPGDHFGTRVTTWCAAEITLNESKKRNSLAAEQEKAPDPE